MSAFLITSISGFFAVFLVVFTASLPYLLRRRARTGNAPVPLRRMGLHYCIGYLIFGVLFLHMLVSMQAGMARGASLTGLNLATVAFLLVMLQVVLGMTLMAGGPKARPFKVVHFAIMLGIVALSAAHLALNSVLLRGLLAG